MHQLLANEPVMLGGEPEGLHQMRVALRRLRAAISLFSDLLTDPQTNASKAELKGIAGELVPARELDVFLKRVVKPIAARNPHRSGVAVVSRNFGKDARPRWRAPVRQWKVRAFEVVFSTGGLDRIGRLDA